MIATLVLVVLSQTPKAEPIKLAAPGLSIVNMKPELREFLTEHIAQEFAKHQVNVVTPKQIEAVLGLERQKQLLGCGEATSCAIELANALGVDALLTGEIGKLGEVIQVNLKIISPVNTQQLAAWSGRVNSEGELFDALGTGAATLAKATYAALGRTPPILVVERRSPPLRKFSFIPAILGGVSAAIGAYYLGDMLGVAGDLSNKSGDTIFADEAQRLKARGYQSQTIAWVGIGFGIAALTATILFYFVDLSPAPGGGGFVWP